MIYVKKDFKEALIPIFAVFCALYTLINPLQCSFYIQKALKICALSLIPALFPFIFLTRLYSISKAESRSGGILQSLVSRVTGLNQNLCSIFILGLFCGFPSGAVGVCSVYERGLCTKDDAERATALSDNCSAAFLISALGMKLTGGTKTGYMLLLCQTLSVISTAVIMKYVFPHKNICHTEKPALNTSSLNGPDKKQSLSGMLTECISYTAKAVINICFCVTFFFLISGVMSDWIAGILQRCGLGEQSIAAVTAIFCGMFEMTSGSFRAAELPFPQNAVMCAFLTSLAGLSVLMQVLSVCKKHSFGAKYFIYAHLCSAFLSALYMILLLFLLSPSGVLTAFSQSVGFVLYKENAFYGGLIPECICAVFLALGTAVGIRKHKSTKK